jgi:hypothetical protein
MALQITAHLGVESVTCSSGWIHRCRRGHNICYRTLAGGSRNVESGTVDGSDFCKRLKVMVSDETGLFPICSLVKLLLFVETPAMVEQNVLLTCNANGNDKLPSFVGENKVCVAVKHVKESSQKI